MPERVLIRLNGGFGFGDTVQATVLLKHLRKHRPDWEVTVLSPRGAHSALHGLCKASLHHGEPEPEADRVLDLELHEAFSRFPDRPCSKAAHYLPASFGIDYDPECGRVEVRVGFEASKRVAHWLRRAGVGEEDGLFTAVVLHYQGGSSKGRKDLEHWQAAQVIDSVRRAGRTPILLDWHGSHQPHAIRVPDAVWGGFGAADAETMAALIGWCEAFVGIDSGPGKAASATHTPSLIVWTKNHPLRYHDPADDTTHLIPAGWQAMAPVEHDADREAYFCSHYQFLTYQGPHDLVGEACVWLARALGEDGWDDPGVTFVVTPGERQAAWAVAKIRSLAGDWRTARVIVSGDRGDVPPGLGLYRLAGLPVKVLPVPVHEGPEKPRNTRGHYLYVSDGYRDGYHYLIPDVTMQQGQKLKDWLPDVPVCWPALALLPEDVLARLWPDLEGLGPPISRNSAAASSDQSTT